MKETPSQTAGPYVHIGLAPAAAGFEIYDQALGAAVFSGDVPGAPITVEGCVYDGEGAAVRDVLIELWQADGDGAHAQGSAEGFGRVISDFETGEWAFETVKPGAVGPGQAPHISLWIVARGINIGLHTRMYFADEENGGDPVLAAIPDQARVASLIAERVGEGRYRFDIRLQGPGETVFFDV